MSAPEPQLHERVGALPGMAQLLPALGGLAPSYLVGGAVRDLLRGAPFTDIDLCVEGDAVAVAGALAERLGGESLGHERFGTATVRAGALSLDVAATRSETYPFPGALPEVRAATLAEDLRRRDFAINAMAIALSGSAVGTLHDPLGGRDDLAHGRIRVLHERSFVDDPTRLLRALRYEARLGFAMDAQTELLAREAVANDAFAGVSGSRVRDELMDLLGEPEAPSAVGRMRDLGVARALHPALDPDPDRVAGAALGSAETGADRALAALAALCSRAPGELEGFVRSLSLASGRRDAVLRAARCARPLTEALQGTLAASELHALLENEPPEALALALGLGAPGEPVLRFLSDLRGVRLEITGDDVTAAGVPPSPAIGRALEETLRRKLEGEVSGREEELRVALEIARAQA